MDDYTPLASADDRAAWLEARRGLLTASDIPALMGTSKWKSPLRLYSEKKGLLAEQESTEAMDWGREMEEPVARWFERRTGRSVTRAQVLLASTKHPWLGCTLDYWQQLSVSERAPLEIKNSRSTEWEDGHVPPSVYDQVQAQMLVTGAARASVAVCLFGAPPVYQDFDRDPGRITVILDACQEFLRRLERDDPPPSPGGDKELLNEMYPTATPGLVVSLSDDASEWHAELEATKREEKRCGERRAELENKIKLALGSASAGVLPNGLGTYTWEERSRKEYVVRATTFRQFGFKKGR